MNVKTEKLHNIAGQINELAISKGFDIAELPRLRGKGKKVIYKYIFSKKGIKDGYAFHTGGRSEIQFNIGVDKWSDGSEIFRYGLAFSLEGGPSLHDPVGTLSPRIKAFNDYLDEYGKRHKNILIWARYHDSKKAEKLHKIPDDWIIKDNFIFFGRFFNKNILEINDSDCLTILEYFDELLPIYKYVENHYKEFESGEQCASRICWNSNSWQKPSGPEGKSDDPNSHENEYGCGHEEWLFDFDKIIDGFHYAFLQPVNRYRDKYTGQIFNIDLYSFNSSDKSRYWIANLKNVEVINKDTEIRIIAEYRKKGWLEEMIRNLDDVGADVDGFMNWVNRGELFNIRFRPQDVYWFDTQPLAFVGRDEVSATRYQILQNYVRAERMRVKAVGSGVDEKNTDSVIRQVNVHKSIECSRLHNQIQNGLKKYLKKKYSNDVIKLEGSTGYSTNIDIVREAHDCTLYYYEVKTYPSAKSCIREALGQLIEYAYFPDEKMADSLVIVSQAPLGEDERKYIKHLQDLLPFTLGYIQFDHEKLCILEEI